MTCDVQTEANNMAYRLMHGQLDDIAERFSFPVVVFVGEQVLLLESAIELVAALVFYRSVLSDAGLVLVSSSVVSSSDASQGQCVVKVENRYFAAEGNDLGRAKINYFCDTSAALPKIRMVEYLEWPCAQGVANCGQLQKMFVKRA